jgi:tetratricopeptide (TPR) repeat protein/TolB-like protein
MPPPGARVWRSDDTVLHYRIIGELGAGGMGVVYRAYDTKLKRTVALKVLPAAQRPDATQRERFLREATAVSSIDHPNIGTVHAVEEIPGGEMFIVMTCYEGINLRQRIKQDRLAPFEALRIASEIARGLGAAHAAGIVHRDLKPSNVILTTQGGVKIIDFGLAKVAANSDLTEEGTRMGTIAYMSPEQAMGQTADHRADLWALGVLLYEMLTGRTPFAGQNAQATLYGIVSAPAPPMPGTAPSIQAVIHKALTKKPEERYQNAGELLAELESIEDRAGDTTIALPDAPSAAGPAAKAFGPAWRWSLATAALAAAATAAAYGWRSGYFDFVSRPENYVAVLPLRIATNDPAQQALAAGWAEVITNALVRYETSNPDLLVVPYNEVDGRRVADAAAARRVFSVQKVLTGDITEGNGRLRVALTLVDAARQQPAGGFSVEGTADALAEMHAQVVARSAGLLGLRAPPAGREAAPQAYANWLRGMGFLERYDQPGNIEAALAEFEAALERGPDALVYVGLSQAYRLRFQVTRDPKWLEPARGHASRAIELDNGLAAAYLARGATRNATADYKGAVEDFERALLLDARLDEAYRGLARAFERMGLHDRAENAHRKAIAARPGYWGGYNSLGRFYSERGRYREAAAQFRNVVQLTPDNAQGYSNLGSVLSRLGQFEEARRMLETSVRIAPTLAAYNNLGNLLVRQRSYSEAARIYEKALELEKNDYVIWANLGAAYYESGQRDNGKDAYRQAAALAEKARAGNPENPRILADLAHYYAFLDKRDEPVALLGTALPLAGDQDADILISAAETYELLGFHERALDNIRKALRAGYPLSEVEQISTFDNLRKDSGFKAIISDLK